MASSIRDRRRRVGRTVPIFVAVIVAACSGSSAPVSDPAPAPAETQTIVPLFGRPFVENHPIDNFFDHDEPFVRDAGVQLTWRGDVHTNLDGHSGYDWVMPSGTPLLAVADGTVAFAGVDPPFTCPGLDGAPDEFVDDQLVVALDHEVGGVGYRSVYVHVSELLVATDEAVRIGDVIALSGDTGCSTDPHLHFQVWRLTGTNSGDAAIVDPYGWQGDGVDPWSTAPDGAESVWLWLPDAAPGLVLWDKEPIPSS